ncbi:hypothetical protein JW877_00230 [bacterium]|nr:hypothetical protein [bacterium]
MRREIYNNNSKWIIFALTLVLLLSFRIAFLQAERYANDVFQFDTDSRITAMGGSWVAQETWAAASYYNPAALSLQQSKSIMLTHSHSFGGLVKYDFLGYSASLKERHHYGISLLYVGGTAIPVTALSDQYQPLSSHNRPYLVEEKGHLQLTLFPAYGTTIFQTVHLGLTLKIHFNKIIDNTAWGLGTNAGLLWSPLEWLRVGFQISDITTTLISWDTGNNETILPAPRIGIAVRKYIEKLRGTLTISSDGQYYLEENEPFWGIGLEYSYQDLISLRVGMRHSTFVTGAGLNIKNWSISANFEDHPELDNSYKISASIYL